MVICPWGVISSVGGIIISKGKLLSWSDITGSIVLFSDKSISLGVRSSGVVATSG